MSQVHIVSTTDTKEDVTKAMGMFSKKSPVEETKPAPAAEKVVDEKPADSGPVEKLESKPVETDEDDSDAEETTDTEDPGKQKKKGGFQKRIDKLTKQKSLAEQERDHWKEQAMKAGTKPAEEQAKPVETKAETPSKNGKPDPNKFDTVGDYMEALSDWKYEERTKAAEQAKKLAETKTEQEKTVAKFQEKIKEFQKTATDMQEVLEAVDHIPLSPALQDVFLQSENGHQLMYELAKEPEEYERISKLPASAQYREMGKREARLSMNSSAEVVAPKTTKAPPPVKPISGKGTVVSTKDPGDMSYQEYKEWHKKTGGKTR